MYPQVLLQHAAALTAQVLKFTQPMEAVVKHYFTQHKNIGSKERLILSDAVYRIVRQKTLFDSQAAIAPKGMGAPERKLAILGLQNQHAILTKVLTEVEREWLAGCSSFHSKLDTLMGAAYAPEQHNLPEWLAKNLQQSTGEHFWPIVRGFQSQAPLVLRTNIRHIKREELLKRLQKDGVPCKPSAYSPWGIVVEGKPALKNSPLMQAGAFDVQDEGSQLISLLTQAARDEMVADYCAGAGGKTLAMGMMMRGTGRLYALDTSASRLKALTPRLQASGLNNVYTTAMTGAEDERLLRLHGKMDCVLVDAPCSGLGTLRRHPDLKWRRQAADIRRFQVTQLDILHNAAKLLKPKGRLVYATCSILPEENEEVAHIFTTKHQDFEQIDAGSILRKAEIDPLSTSLTTGGDNAELYVRTWPHLHGTDGFFAAVWQKSA